jgi:hypothetical protein
MAESIEFEGRRDQLGYELVRASTADPELMQDTVFMTTVALSPVRVSARGPFTALLGMLGGPQSSWEPPYDRIVGRGGKLLPCRPLGQCDTLFAVFIRAARNPEGLLEFVQQHGPLTAAGNRKRGEDVRFGLFHAALMRRLLERGAEGRLADLRALGHDGLICARPKFGLSVEPGGKKPQITFRVSSLVEGLWVQLAHAVSGIKTVRRCPYCGEWFTGRRADARFCCPEHQIAFNSEKRIKGGLDAS